MKKDSAKESKALLEARAWKARVSRAIERKGWDAFLKDAHVTAAKWQRDADALRLTKLVK